MEKVGVMMWAYRLCLVCGKFDLLGDADTLEAETQRIFYHWQSSAVKEKFHQNTPHWVVERTEDMFVSIEDPSMCDECLKDMS